MGEPTFCEYYLFNADDADRKALATARVAIGKWEEIAFILSPIIGEHEATLIFERSVLLCNVTYPWMKGSSGGFKNSMNLSALAHSIAQQPAEAAAAGASLLLTTFHDLFADVVGTALARQLLPSSLLKLPAQDDAI